MAVSPEILAALVSVQADGAGLVVTLRGQWRITTARPSWVEVLAGRQPVRVQLVLGEVESLDSALLLFLYEAQKQCLVKGVPCDVDRLPKKLRELLAQFAAASELNAPTDRSQNLLSMVGLAALDLRAKLREIVHFVGTCVLSAIGLARQPQRFRWRDCLTEMQQCGAMALPIVSLISLLVGLIMAYQAAVQLRQFGADIYVADLVGLSVVREMGPMMAAIIIAGRTGAAFAATLGNMRANEEIDALETLGVSPIDFLVMPRLVALGLMMPLLALYANLLGILGGMFVAMGVLEIPPSAYWIETQTIIDLSDISTGLIKSVTFGLLIGAAGCLRGLHADRSVAGVGQATTSAVVTATLLIIVADALFAVVFNILHI
ncbi:MAG: MlaE family lipid ABC transporter permease subunit [Opitutaceae bacterium]|nr:MlaE family lipid ABC transporter permease subunit [Opitutaceae bacterium]